MTKRKGDYVHKLTAAQVKRILAAVRAGERQSDLAREYGVTPQAIHNLIVRCRKRGVAAKSAEPVPVRATWDDIHNAPDLAFRAGGFRVHSRQGRLG